MIFIINPNANQIVSKTLKDLGHKVIPSLSFDTSVLTHPDQQIHPLDDRTAITAPEYYPYYRQHLPESIHLLQGNTSLSGTYPSDCAYNVARVGQSVFCNTRTVDSVLYRYYQQKGYQIFHVNQGYTKCNIVPVGEDCILTEDIGIHNIIIANQLNIQSIFLPVGEVALAGFPYGFIGGSCGGGKNQLFWYGNPEEYSYFSKIKIETEKRGIENIALSSGPLWDWGGIICFPL